MFFTAVWDASRGEMDGAPHENWIIHQRSGGGMAGATTSREPHSHGDDMLNAQAVTEREWSRPRMTTSLGELITAIYDVALEELDDPELAIAATDAALTNILSRSHHSLATESTTH